MTVYAERSSVQIGKKESKTQGAITALSHHLLSGLRIPLYNSQPEVVQRVIAQASVQRLPTQAIDTVSTADRQMVSDAFPTAEEKNLFHESWLGRKAQHILHNAQDHQTKIAYKEILGLDIEILQKSIKKTVARIYEERKPRRQKQQAKEIPPEIQEAITSYTEYLVQQQAKGVSLSLQEVGFLTLQQPSRELIEEALGWEKVKQYLHTAVYTPFLKDQTDSKGLAEFAVTNYKKSRGNRGVNIDDVALKASLLCEDFDDMTARGNTMIALIRSLAVVQLGMQTKDAKAFSHVWGSLSHEYVKELDTVISEQQRLDKIATEAVRTDVQYLTHELFRMRRFITEEKGPLTLTMQKDEVKNRIETIITSHVVPLLANVSTLTADAQGNPVTPDSTLLTHIAHFPDILDFDRSLSVLTTQKNKLRHIALLRDVLSQDTLHAPIAALYTPEYFLHSKRGKRSSGYIRHIETIFKESKVFQTHREALQTRFGFLPVELDFFLRQFILDAQHGTYDFIVHGRSEHGPSAQTPLSNRDRYYHDERFKLLMVADGAGSAKWSKSAAIIMQRASKTVMDELWEKGVRYPLTEAQAKETLMDMVRRGANMMCDVMPQRVRDYLLTMEDHPQTGEIYHPHLGELEDYFMTTFVGVLPFVDNGVEYLAVASIGDSRAYMYNPDGQLEQLTLDDSVLHNYLEAYPQTEETIENILNNFDKEIPSTVSSKEVRAATTEAIYEEVSHVDVWKKQHIVEDMLNFLSKLDLRLTLSEMRSKEGEERRELITLQKILQGNQSPHMMGLNEQVTAVVEFFLYRRNLMTRFVTARGGYLSEEDISVFSLKPGARIFVASDAIPDTLSNRRIANVLGKSTNLEESIENIHKETLAALGCERVGKGFTKVPHALVSVRRKYDDGITFGGIEMTRKLVGLKEDEKPAVAA